MRINGVVHTIPCPSRHKKTDMSNVKSGKRLKELLDEKKMTQVELAELTNYTPQHIHNIIKGHRNMSREAAHTFAQILGISEEYLLCEIDNKTILEEMMRGKNNELYFLLSKVVSLIEPNCLRILNDDQAVEELFNEIIEYIKFKIDWQKRM